ncbi:uncharacterized protein K452DRAFT_309634 [Aplosporella prunicola CBS 121167]|uniref:Uncharacterized protein n=1 Tax=Aplosporella prunicola CBS 121167 TaxID=1176127 RepID=A0A6A6BAU6_9PEZI|nr:uncharacterized protein K452DRAFT_309634 [Aplosporella prunicola CBS 121167]KAF2140483.1 hypothetical protein K452DRAFT_309634 [Aplosporella prunicola CBS 121167]
MSTSVTDTIANGGVYLGAWTNWSHGSVQGATITLTKRDGGLLIAFLALFVTTTGASFWRLFCFVAHFALSNRSGPQDGLYHQMQAVLRNAATTTTGVIYFTQLLGSWRQHAQNPWKRVLPLLGFTALIMAVFSIASIFSSRISTATGNEVLISSPNCGRIDATLDSNIYDYFAYLRRYTSELTITGASYAKQCYEGNGTAQECSTYVKKELPATIYSNMSCPFPGNEKICLQSSTNLRIDTGLIDSHDDLGMNAAPADRFAFRRVVDCAPLVTEGYARQRNGSDNRTQDATIEYYYGDRRHWLPYDDANFTYVYSASSKDNYNMNADYTLGVALAAASLNDSTFTPIAELERKDAETALFFLSANNVFFAKPVDDDWFSAHTPFGDGLHGATLLSGSMPAFHKDQATGVLACTTQHQFCNPNKKKDGCTGLDGWRAGISASSRLWDNSAQKAAFAFWADTYTSLGIQIPDMVSNLGVSALTARDTLVQGIQGPLPRDQWQREVLHWHASTMAKLQRILVEAATGPSDPDMFRYIVKPSTEAEHLRCANQKVKSPSYTSFSTLGLGLTLALGLLINALSLGIEPLLRVLQARQRCAGRPAQGLYRRLEWAANETLQLQRLAHEELGAGSWCRGDECPPVTRRGDRLALLDVRDVRHPRLVVLGEAGEGLLGRGRGRGRGGDDGDVDVEARGGGRVRVSGCVDEEGDSQLLEPKDSAACPVVLDTGMDMSMPMSMPMATGAESPLGGSPESDAHNYFHNHNHDYPSTQALAHHHNDSNDSNDDNADADTHADAHPILSARLTQPLAGQYEVDGGVVRAPADSAPAPLSQAAAGPGSGLELGLGLGLGLGMGMGVGRERRSQRRRRGRGGRAGCDADGGGDGGEGEEVPLSPVSSL